MMFKVGDIVIESGRMREELTRVVRVTKTMAVVEGGSRFSLDSGCLVGGSTWCRIRIRVPSIDALTDIIRRNNVEFITCALDSLDVDDIIRVKQFVEGLSEKV